MPINTQSSYQNKTILAVLLFMWAATGSNFLGFKVALQDIPPFSLTAVRVALAAAILLPLAMILADNRAITGKQVIGCAVASIFFVFFGQGIVVWGMQGLSSGQTALILACVPMLGVLLGWLVRKRMPSMRILTGLAIGLAGLALVVSGSLVGTMPMPSLAAVLLGAFGWALGTVIAPKLDLPANALMATLLQFGFGGAILATTGFIAGEHTGWIASARPTTWLALAWIVVVGSVIGFGSFMYLRARVHDALANSFFYTTPVVALFLGWAVLGEAVTYREVVGGAAAFVGVFLILSASGVTLRGKSGLPSSARRGSTGVLSAKVGTGFTVRKRDKTKT
ncbi:MAG: EamA family transporter [Roseitalea sp.]|nr:EamA family transporter [Roseitalea sp.]MBO6722053.1 EamA family transporter [Roseitalea sp.]MBO6741673.1 EamA family transporter [Roseitalea sp.]